MKNIIIIVGLVRLMLIFISNRNERSGSENTPGRKCLPLIIKEFYGSTAKCKYDE